MATEGLGNTSGLSTAELFAETGTQEVTIYHSDQC